MQIKWQRVPGHRNLKGRAGHTATLVGKKMFILGGRNGNEFLNDLWAFDTETEQWKLLQQKVPFSPRAYHTATLVGDHMLWVIGGSDQFTMYGDIHVLDTISLKWTSPVTSGHVASKRRGTHAAVLHPLQRNSILIYGGYGGVESCWMSDLVILHTGCGLADTLEWEELEPDGSHPSRRGYHTLTVFGTCVALFGGKGEGGILKDGNLSIYDAVFNRWITPAVSGEAPLPCSNHAASLLEDNLIVIHGGRHASFRLRDMFVLQTPPVVSGTSSVTVVWHMVERAKSLLTQKKVKGKRDLEMASPSGRSAHSLIVKGRSLYVFGGYGGQGLTFNDMFVVQNFPRLPELGYPNQPPVGLMKHKMPDKELDEGIEEGWRSTKRPRKHFDNHARFLREAVGAASSVPAKLEQLLIGENTVHAATGIRVDEPVVDVSREPNVQDENRHISFLECQSLATLVQENGLYQKEIYALQEMINSLRATIKEKELMESEFSADKKQLEQKLLRLQSEKIDAQQQVEVQEKKLMLGNQKIGDLEVEIENAKSSLQALRVELEEKERERYSTFLRAKASEQQSEDLAKSLEEIKSIASELIDERNGYKSCVQKLETELEKQMQTLQQASSKYETEKTFLLKEISERKGTADRLFVELGVFKESTRVLEETVNRQAKQLDQEGTRVEALRKEKEDMNQKIAIMATEYKQVAAAKETAEATCERIRSELKSARYAIDQKESEISRLKETADQTRDHISSLHASLKKDEETKKAQLGEIEWLRALIQETEEFEKDQVKSLQSHAEKLQCARQSCPH
eukprot:c26812_g1_i3 orf=277-2679(-)